MVKANHKSSPASVDFSIHQNGAAVGQIPGRAERYRQCTPRETPTFHRRIRALESPQLELHSLQVRAEITAQLRGELEGPEGMIEGRIEQPRPRASQG